MYSVANKGEYVQIISAVYIRANGAATIEPVILIRRTCRGAALSIRLSLKAPRKLDLDAAIAQVIERHDKSLRGLADR